MENLSLLIKPSSSLCNMNCSYCFYYDVSNNRECFNKGLMSWETAEVLIRHALVESRDFCAFAFQGGEPTIAGVDFYEFFVDTVNKHNTEQKQIFYSIQTNGYDLSEEFIRFFKSNNFLLGVSLDGYEELHNLYRKDRNNQGTYSKIMNNVSLMNKYGVEFNILTVVTNDLAKNARRYYDWLKVNNFRFAQLVPCIDDFAGGLHELSRDNYSVFLNDLFEIWYDDFISGNYFSIRSFDNYVRLANGMPGDSCSYNGKCDAYPTIEADGSVYPCDFYALDKYYLGNVASASFNELLSTSTAENFESQSRIANEDCAECEFVHICRNGCYRDRVCNKNKYCQSYKDFFSKNYGKISNAAKMVFG